MTDIPRQAEILRTTKETNIKLRLALDGSSRQEITTGIGFFDHMLTLFARHALMDLELDARGDLNVDQHHTVEDVGICLGQALERALGDKAGIERFGHAYVSMDESLARAVVDLSGRAHLVYHVSFQDVRLGEFPSELVEEFWKAFAGNGKLSLHLECLYGSNQHHICEAVFKAAGRALGRAARHDPRVVGVPSTKGFL